jgi:hypothetical protein
VAATEAAADARFASGEWPAKLASLGKRTFAILEANQIPTGGWGYYDDPIFSQRPKWATSFSTSVVLPALQSGERLGWVDDARVRERATRFVSRCALPNGAYAYDLRPIPWIAGDSINDVKGSLCRIQVANWALASVGEKKITPDRLRTGLESSSSTTASSTWRCMRPVPHEAYYYNSGYFYLFGHYYAARVIELLPRRSARAGTRGCAPHLVKVQRADGSSRTSSRARYMKVAGTPFLALALELGLPPDTVESGTAVDGSVLRGVERGSRAARAVVQGAAARVADGARTGASARCCRWPRATRARVRSRRARGRRGGRAARSPAGTRSAGTCSRRCALRSCSRGPTSRRTARCARSTRRSPRRRGRALRAAARARAAAGRRALRMARGRGLPLEHAHGLRSRGARYAFPAQALRRRRLGQCAVKCVFVGAPLWRLWGLDGRLSAELARMALDLADERRSAGRPVPHRACGCASGRTAARAGASARARARADEPDARAAGRGSRSPRAGEHGALGSLADETRSDVRAALARGAARRRRRPSAPSSALQTMTTCASSIPTSTSPAARPTTSSAWPRPACAP